MSIPGFTAQRALGPVSGYRGASRPAGGGQLTPALSIFGGGFGASSSRFWPCFRNCYDRCGGSSPDSCMVVCDTICNWNPNVWF